MVNNQIHPLIAAIVLAAGKSVRFGQPKLLMPWGKSTVIEHIIQTIRRSGIKDIHVVVDSAGRIWLTHLRI